MSFTTPPMPAPHTPPNMTYTAMRRMEIRAAAKWLTGKNGDGGAVAERIWATTLMKMPMELSTLPKSPPGGRTPGRRSAAGGASAVPQGRGVAQRQNQAPMPDPKVNHQADMP